jgi:hypothetical protein
VTGPLNGAGTGGAGRMRDLERQVKMLRAAVRDNSARLGKIEKWAHYVTGFVSANVLVAVFNLVRGFVDSGT